MVNSEHLCEHLNQVIDEKEGITVCTNCGLVLDEFLYKENIIFHQFSDIQCQKDEEEIKEILARLHLPECFLNRITENYNKCEKKSMKRVAYVIYETLNKLGYPISIKEISAVTGICDSTIYDLQTENQSLVLKPEQLLEKYCKKLELSYQTYSVIKELLPKNLESGHNPLTIIATVIYIYCKEHRLKYSMKHIAENCNINSVSIQRYLKYYKEQKCLNRTTD